MNDEISLPELPSLRTASLRVRYVADDAVCFNQEPVSVWRGLIGRFLSRLSPARDGELQAASLYELFFETPHRVLRPLDHLSAWTRGRLGLTGSHVPHPFVLRSRTPVSEGALPVLRPGDTYELELILIEKALGYLPALCAMFQGLGHSGVGRRVRQRGGQTRRGCMQLADAVLHLDTVRLTLFEGRAWTLPAVVDVSLFDQVKIIAPVPTAPVPDDVEMLRLRTRTPVHLRVKGHSVHGHDLTPGLLMLAMLRRLFSLAACYSPQAPREEALASVWAAYEKLAQSSKLKAKNLRWEKRERYSASQQRVIPAGGLFGTLTVHGSPGAMSNWRRLLQIIEPLHVGKDSSFGQGWLTMQDATSG